MLNEYQDIRPVIKGAQPIQPMEKEFFCGNCRRHKPMSALGKIVKHQAAHKCTYRTTHKICAACVERKAKRIPSGVIL